VIALKCSVCNSQLQKDDNGLWCDFCKEYRTGKETIDNETGRLPKTFSADQLEELNIPEPEYLVNNLIVKNSMMMVGAPQRSFKSYVMMILAIHIAKGIDFLGFKTQKANVLYLDGESGHTLLKKRILQIKNGLGIDLPRNLIIDLSTPNLISLEPEFRDKLEKLEVKVLILDPFKAFFHGRLNENSADDMRGWYTNFLKPLKEEFGLTIILIHHARKSKQNDETMERWEKLRGSSEISNFCDMILLVDRKHKEQFIELITEKNKFGVEIEPVGIEFNFDDVNASLTLNKTDKETWVLAHTKIYVDQVLEWIKNKLAENVSIFKTKELKEFLVSSGVKKWSADPITHRVIADLETLGKIKKLKRGIYKIVSDDQTKLGN